MYATIYYNEGEREPPHDVYVLVYVIVYVKL